MTMLCYLTMLCNATLCYVTIGSGTPPSSRAARACCRTGQFVTQRHFVTSHDFAVSGSSDQYCQTWLDYRIAARPAPPSLCMHVRSTCLAGPSANEHRMHLQYVFSRTICQRVQDAPAVRVQQDYLPKEYRMHLQYLFCFRKCIMQARREQNPA